MKKELPEWWSRFWDKVSDFDDNGCRNWTAARDRNGYGQLNIDGLMKKAHRLIYEVAHGPIPEGMSVCHKCDNASCVELSHLFLGTQADNVRDAQQKCRMARGSAHHATVLTEEQVREIKDSDDLGVNLARRYKVKPSVISLIKTGKRWSHIKSRRDQLLEEI